MNNKGRIAVFMSLMTAVLLIFITFLVHVVILSSAQSKTVIASRLAMSDIKACYNSYIFEHYHILLFDKNAGGKGEAYLEEQLQQYFSDKLGTEYRDTQAVFTDFTMVYDDSCAALYKQMQEHVTYALVEQGVELGLDTLIKKTAGKDGTIPEELTEDMQEAEEEAQHVQGEAVQYVQEENEQHVEADAETGLAGGTETTETETEHGIPETEQQLANTEHKKEDDPRDYTKSLTDMGLLCLVLPEDTEVSEAAIRMDTLPSLQAGVVLSEYDDIDRSFHTMRGMSKDLLMLASWNDCLSGKAVLAAYIQDVFNCFTEQQNSETVLQYEQEYLIVGSPSDVHNLKSVMNRIIGIRFPIDYISVCAQPQKMMRLGSIATSICFAVPGMIPVVKYLLAGCWAYIEAIADARVLFAGERLPFEKTAENWMTDIDNIEASIERASGGDDNGLSYQDYLLVLEMINADAVTYRMLDIMQVNAQQETPSFQMKDAVCGFSADFQTTFQTNTFWIHQSAFY